MSPPVSMLAELLEKRREEIVQRWTDQVARTIAPGPKSRTEIRDHLPDYLDRLAEALRRPSPRTSPAARDAAEVAKQHGEQRFRVGFSLEAMVREYGVLRELILELVEEYEVRVTFGEVHVLADFISTAISEAVVEYTRQRAQADALAKASELRRDAQLATILRSIGDAVIATDAAGRVTFLNPVAEALTGWTQTEVEGRPLGEVFRVVDEHTRQPVESPVDRVLCEGVAVGPGNHRLLVNRAGADLPVDDSAAPIRGGDEALAGVVLVFRDVSETKRIEAERARFLVEVQEARAEAEAERQKLHDLFEQAPVAICILEGPRHTYTFANPAYKALVDEGDLVGKPLLEAFPAVDVEGFKVLLDKVVASGKPFIGNEVPIKLHGKDEVDYFTFVYHPKRNSRGEVDGVLVCASGVTTQVRALQRAEIEAKARQEVEEHLRRLIEVTQVGSWEVNPSTGDVVVDARYREMTGLMPEEPFTVEKGLDLIHDEDRPRVNQAFTDVLAGKDGGRYELEYRTRIPATGGTRWVSAWGQVDFDGEGKAVRFLGTAMDVTARKEAELARECLLEALAQQPSLLVSVLEGPELIFTMANPIFQEQVAHGRPVIGRPLSEAFPESKPQGFEALLHRVLETGQPFVGREVRAALDTGDGMMREGFYNLVYQPVRGPSGRFESILSIGHKVTDIVRAREQAARVAAEEKERAAFEQQLIGIVSHDLRNPLGAILLGASILRTRTDLDERSMKIIKRIYSSVERATALVKDVLDFTQARLGGGLPVRRAPMDAHTVVRQIAEELQVNYPDRSIRVALEGDGKGDWDAERVGQVLTNLASNALKYGKPGTPVTMRAGSDGEAVVLEVHNEGTPIPAEAMERIFQPLQRGTTQADRLGRSVGLGLYIVKHIVEAHGGSIGVASSAEEGTTFSVRLPRRPAPPALAPAS